MMGCGEEIVAIVQARMGSERLPGKVMMTLQGRPMIEWVIARLRRCRYVRSVILAIPEGAADDDLAEWARRADVWCWRGSERNVLARYYHAAREFGARQIVRITGDCPCIDPEVVDLVALAHLSRQPEADYTSNTLERTYPRGLDAEAFSFAALEAAYRWAYTKAQIEHVTPYLYERPAQFTLTNVRNGLDFSHIRLTVDERRDFEMVSKVYEHFGGGDFWWREAVQYLHLRPEVMGINQDVKQKPI